MIIPISSSKAFRAALVEAFEKYNMNEASAEEREAFCQAFKAGWESCKQKTFEYLDNLKKEYGNE